MFDRPNISVIGGGSWGTALVKLLSEKAGELYWWVRDPANAEFIRHNHRNPNYLTLLSWLSLQHFLFQP